MSSFLAQSVMPIVNWSLIAPEVIVCAAAVLVMLDQPLWTPQLAERELREIGEAFVMAAWRARACCADGIMLSTVDGGPFEQLISPLRNQRSDGYGGSVFARSQLLREVVEGIERWLGSQFIVGVRLNAEEFTPGGLSLQDARLLATRLASAGVRLLEIQAQTASDTPIAHFPGWCVPMAAGIRAVVDIPVMVGGLLDDPELADSVIRDGGADLISVGDYHISNNVGYVLAGRPRTDDAGMLELLEPYRGHRQRVVRLIEATGMGAPRYGPRMPLRNNRGR